jgi:DNA polymerase delta subunit 1
MSRAQLTGCRMLLMTLNVQLLYLISRGSTRLQRANLSLYPSIIIAKNLCFSTLLIHKNDLPPESIHEGYGESYFASADVKPGVLPAMLIHLLDERVKVKNIMKTTTDAAEKLVLDGRQKAIKVAANAVYGATGAPSSKLQWYLRKESD